MPAQIIVTRMTKADAEKKVVELDGKDVVEVADYEGRPTCIVRSKIPVVKRGPELDRAYAILQAVADADSAIGMQRRKAREAKAAKAPKETPSVPTATSAPSAPATTPAKPKP
jgi:hypothetical protein